MDISNITVEEDPQDPRFMNKETEKDQETSYEKLLNEFTKSREELKKMLSDVEECKKSVLKDVSTSNDYRNKYAREERLKTLSTFFQNELQIRQEYNRSLLSEIEMRRKLDMNGDDDNEVDIRAIMKQLASFNKKEEKNNGTENG